MPCDCDVLCECPPLEGDENLYDGELGTVSVHMDSLSQVITPVARGIVKTVRTFANNLYEHYTSALAPLADAAQVLAKSLKTPAKSPRWGPSEDLSKRPQVCAQAIPRLPERCAPVAQFPHLVVRTTRHVPP